MKQSREELVKLIKRELVKNIGNKGFGQDVINKVHDKYNLPISIISDVVSLRVNPIDLSDNELFYITDVLLKGKHNDDFFTDDEINYFSTNIYEEHKISFPIKFDMIQIAPDQWIGKITVKELMMLRDYQLIYYNEITQRTLQHVVNRDFEYYQISLNRNAVNAIEDSYDNNSYIPNTITLNLPEDADYKYVEGKLIIKNVSSFDIIDGYHRYVAISNKYNKDPDFDYPMELRIVCFSVDKAKQFIWQEDQKTKMKKLDSDSFNQNNPANQVIELINQSVLLRGIISRNNGIIDTGTCSALINVIYFPAAKNVNRKAIIDVKNELIGKFNLLLDLNSSILNTKWDYYFTLATFVLFTEDIPSKKLLSEIDKLYHYISNPELKNVTGRKGVNINSRLITRIKKIYNEIKEV